MSIYKKYASGLVEFSETNHATYQQVLNECQNEIIDVFGGLDTMIQLCLTNPQFSSDTYKLQFESFKSLMESKNINTKSEFKSDDYVMHVPQASLSVSDDDNKKTDDVILCMQY